MSDPVIRCLTCGERFREKPVECPVCRQNKFEARADLVTPDQGLPAETEPETEDDDDDDREADLEDDEDEMPPPKPPPKSPGRPSGGRPSTKRKR